MNNIDITLMEARLAQLIERIFKKFNVDEKGFTLKKINSEEDLEDLLINKEGDRYWNLVSELKRDGTIGYLIEVSARVIEIEGTKIAFKFNKFFRNYENIINELDKELEIRKYDKEQGFIIESLV